MATMIGTVTFLAALGAGLNAGLFFIFSVCIMAAFARLAPADGIAAMNAINVVILNPWFLAVFMGTALLSVALIVLAAMHGGSALWFAAAAGIFYLAGTIGVTMVFNVPLNDALAAADPLSRGSVALWERYLTAWTGWNHVRTLSALAALALFVFSYARQGATG
ncbi:anthrone oxygenase family protein [Sinorhizobium sp. BG8]|uniref:anthrone oxygenase family protein n=1 Tax=Sinorhizobium sp. BG8 TaxID=2613773 RepID=UPI00193C9B37|nr:anthrone oxygenase family protein [Sinorhizobium sp. BG8]QRM55933.1 DUF1772 domain-containing protein [Sinorhizobium sp. BG8]